MFIELVIAGLTVSAFGAGLLAMKPLDAFLARRHERPMPPARRRLMSTTFCIICRTRVPFSETEFTHAHGHTCTKHYIASAETLQAAA